MFERFDRLDATFTAPTMTGDPVRDATNRLQLIEHAKDLRHAYLRDMMQALIRLPARMLHRAAMWMVPPTSGRA